MGNKKIIHFAGLPFSMSSPEDIVRPGDAIKFIVTANAQIISLANRDRNYCSALPCSTIVFDGRIPYVLARCMNKGDKFYKISGSDLIYKFLDFCRANEKSIFFLGASQQANVGAQNVVANRYGVRVGGAWPMLAEDLAMQQEDEIIAAIRAFRPTYLLVAFGAPKQELWIAKRLKLLEQCGVKVVMGCGGSIDFLSGKIKRAPHLVQQLGLEGFYRLFQEPGGKRIHRLLYSFLIFRYAFRRSRLY